MRGTKAKKIRRLVFGDLSTRARGRRYWRRPDGSLVCLKRAEYQRAKREAR